MPVDLSYYGRSPRFMKVSLFEEERGPVPRSPKEVREALEMAISDILNREHHSSKTQQLNITSHEASQRTDDLHHLISLCEFYLLISYMVRVLESRDSWYFSASILLEKKFGTCVLWVGF